MGDYRRGNNNKPLRTQKSANLRQKTVISLTNIKAAVKVNHSKIFKNIFL